QPRRPRSPATEQPPRHPHAPKLRLATRQTPRPPRQRPPPPLHLPHPPPTARARLPPKPKRPQQIRRQPPHPAAHLRQPPPQQRPPPRNRQQTPRTHNHHYHRTGLRPTPRRHHPPRTPPPPQPHQPMNLNRRITQLERTLAREPCACPENTDLAWPGHHPDSHCATCGGERLTYILTSHPGDAEALVRRALPILAKTY